MTTNKRQKIKLREVNRHLVCRLCRGYYVDATTIAECLHSFCRSCIIKYLEKNSFCPICEVQIHKTKPYLNLRLDKALQDVVYKLVPGLYQNEMLRRRKFYEDKPDIVPFTTPEQRGVEERLIFSPEDSISLSLEFVDSPDPEPDAVSSHSSENGEDFPLQLGLMKVRRGDSTARKESTDSNEPGNYPKRFLLCPAVVSIRLLKKFLTQKFELSSSMEMEIMYKKVSLPDHYTLMDVAYIFTWKRMAPMRLFYQFIKTQSEAMEEAPKPETTPLPTSVPEPITLINQPQNITKKQVESVQKTVKPITLAETPLSAPPKKPVEVVAKKPVEAVMKKPVETVVKKSVETVAKKAAETVAKKSVEMVLKKSVEMVAKKPVEAVTKQPVEVVSKKPAESTNKKPVETGNKKSVETVVKKPVEIATKMLLIRKPVECPTKKPDLNQLASTERPLKKPDEGSLRKSDAKKPVEQTEAKKPAENLTKVEKPKTEGENATPVNKPVEKLKSPEPKTEIEPKMKLTPIVQKLALKLKREEQEGGEKMILNPKSGEMEAEKKGEPKSLVQQLKTFRKEKTPKAITITTTPSAEKPATSKEEANVSIEIKTDGKSEYDFESSSPPKRIMSLQEYTKSEQFKTKYSKTNGAMNLQDFRKKVLNGKPKSNQLGNKDRNKEVPLLYRIHDKKPKAKDDATRVININTPELKATSPPKTDKRDADSMADAELLRMLLKRRDNAQKKIPEKRAKLDTQTKPTPVDLTKDVVSAEKYPETKKDQNMVEMLIAIAQKQSIEPLLKVPQFPHCSKTTNQVSQNDINQALQFFQKLSSDMSLLEAKTQAEHPVPPKPPSMLTLQQHYLQQIELIRMLKRQHAINNETKPVKVDEKKPAKKEETTIKSVERTLSQIQEQAEIQRRIVAAQSCKTFPPLLQYFNNALFRDPAKSGTNGHKSPLSPEEQQLLAKQHQMFNAGLTTEMNLHEMFHQYLTQQLKINQRKGVKRTGSPTPALNSPPEKKMPARPASEPKESTTESPSAVLPPSTSGSVVEKSPPAPVTSTPNTPAASSW